MRSIRCARSRRSAASTASGFTSTARMAASRRRFPARPTICAALAEADSVAVDPHKWLYAPLEAGCALVRDAEALRARVLVSSALLPLRGAGDELRRLRAAELPRVPRAQGVARAAAGGGCRVSADDRATTSRCRGRWRTPSARTRSWSSSRRRSASRRSDTCRPTCATASASPTAEAHLDALNRALLDRLQHGGEAFVSNAVVRRPLPAPRLHRQLPHDARRRRGRARHRRAGGTTRSIESFARRR